MRFTKLCVKGCSHMKSDPQPSRTKIRRENCMGWRIPYLPKSSIFVSHQLRPSNLATWLSHSSGNGYKAISFNKLTWIIHLVFSFSMCCWLTFVSKEHAASLTRFNKLFYKITLFHNLHWITFIIYNGLI